MVSRKREQKAEELLPDAKKPTVSSGSKEESDVDAMGQDKRRSVIGHAYGPSKKSQVIFLAVVVGLLVVVVGGYTAAIQAFDQPKDDLPDAAPWVSSAAVPKTPGEPCGEPGNPYPSADTSPCSEVYHRTHAPLNSGEDDKVPTPGQDAIDEVATDTSDDDDTLEENAEDDSGAEGDYEFLDAVGDDGN